MTTKALVTFGDMSGEQNAYAYIKHDGYPTVMFMMLTEFVQEHFNRLFENAEPYITTEAIDFARMNTVLRDKFVVWARNAYQSGNLNAVEHDDFEQMSEYAYELRFNDIDYGNELMFELVHRDQYSEYDQPSILRYHVTIDRWNNKPHRSFHIL